MEICKTIEQFRRVLKDARAAGRSIGLAPTMGNLHAGHASLIDRAAADRHFVAVTIFVNPTQFGPTEDFASYPRTPQEDLELCRGHGASVVFMPSVQEMYPDKALTTVRVAELTKGLCGRARPGHFEGVCTVVAKLFNIAQPDAAYFGQKDAQQAAVISRMIKDLNFPIRMVICPIVREPDGLAMSSRNRYLSPQERSQAPQLFAALELARAMIEEAVANASAVTNAMRKQLSAAAPLGQIDYVEQVDPESLMSVETIEKRVLIALAVKFPSVRLIDNMLVDPPGKKG